VGRDGAHFESHKADRILSWLYKGKFDQLKLYPLTLEKRPEGYFVTTDGTHWGVVVKGVPLEKLYVEYYTVSASALEK
jgi:hypothetical protein